MPEEVRIVARRNGSYRSFGPARVINAEDNEYARPDTERIGPDASFPERLDMSHFRADTPPVFRGTFEDDGKASQLVRACQSLDSPPGNCRRSSMVTYSLLRTATSAGSASAGSSHKALATPAKPEPSSDDFWRPRQDSNLQPTA
jgi:hypothetical protein